MEKQQNRVLTFERELKTNLGISLLKMSRTNCLKEAKRHPTFTWIQSCEDDMDKGITLTSNISTREPTCMSTWQLTDIHSF